MPYIFVLNNTVPNSVISTHRRPISKISLYSMLCQHEMTSPDTFADQTTVSSKIQR